MKNTILLIDGAYLSFISKNFRQGKPLKFDIGKFSERLAEKNNMLLEKTIYYTAPPYQSPKPKEDELARKSKYDRFVSKLKKIHNFIVREGRCQKIDSTFTQKGVDSLLTRDLLKTAFEGKIKTIMLLTSDTDFVPIIEEIRKDHHVEVVLIYFTDRKRKSAFSLSNYLWKACDKKILLKQEDFENLSIEEKCQ